MEAEYKEQWSVVINRKEFILNEVEKTKLEMGMKNGDRWFKTGKGDIFSISHIESVVLHDRQIKNQLSQGENVEDDLKPVSRKKMDQYRKEIYSKIGKKIK